MKGKKIAALLMAAVLLMAAMTGCSGSGDKGTLKVATNAEFDPWEYLENGEFVGADMDIIRAVADKMGMKVEIQNMEFEAVLSALVSKSCDVAVAGLTVNKKRAEQVDFSSAYYKVSQDADRPQ